MKKIILLCGFVSVMFGMTGCAEYYYAKDGYNKSNCSYYDMPYIKDYCDNKRKYKNYDSYMQSNYQTSNGIYNAANARRAYKNYCDSTKDTSCFYPVEVK